MTDALDFTGDPPDYYWSDLDEDALRGELQSLLEHHNVPPVVRAWTEESAGPAFAELEDGRVYRFAGDGTVTAIELVESSAVKLPGVGQRYYASSIKASVEVEAFNLPDDNRPGVDRARRRVELKLDERFNDDEELDAAIDAFAEAVREAARR